MKFSIFSSARAQQGEECTYEKYLDVATRKDLSDLCDLIANEKDPDKRGELKKRLPVITWQAYFPGKRISKEAQPSGLFMLDIDHVDDPWKLYSEKIAGRKDELGIVYVGKTASCHGLRIVAKCLPTLSTIEDCQRWLASSLKVEYDGVCKDWARCSYLVHDRYTFCMNAKAIWQEEAAEGTQYAIGANPVQVNAEFENALPATPSDQPAEVVDQREGLFGGSLEYKGIPYERIIKTWFRYTGGEPTAGERNTRLYQLALRLRYITDFNEATMLRVMPDYGLPKSELREIVRHSLTTTRASKLPNDLQDALDRIDKEIKLGAIEDEENIDEDEIITATDTMPHLPPVFKQWADIAPDDFKKAVVLCQLPILGTLGSRLRAEYLDGRVHSPSFQVSLEAPQASGKSFLTVLANYELAQIKEQDERARMAEREYQEKMNKLRMLNVKVKKSESSEIPEKPKTIVRYVPATMSITKLLMRMSDAQGLHLFAMAEEIDTVLKAFKRGFSSFSDALRVSFDNGEYGQDYASDQSFSGMVKLYYNALFSGTPKAMCRFYPDVEDGLVSRVLFCTLPDQFGKPMPIWKTFTAEQKRIVDVGLVRLSEISLQGDEVQPEHMIKLGFLNKIMDGWLKEQQLEALRQDDRTRDIFCRRAAVVGFRAGMLGYFLWGESPSPTIRKYTGEFAVWVANCMLNQHILRFNVQGTHSNVNPWEGVLKSLPEEFTREDVKKALDRENIGTAPRMIIYKWRLLGVIESIGQKGVKNTKFKKIHKK